MLEQRDKRLGLAGIVRAKAKDVIARDRKRRRRATLADHKNIMRIRIRLDLGHLGAGLGAYYDPNSALIQVSDSIECLSGSSCVSRKRNQNRGGNIEGGCF